ncbi:MAG: CPBP family intramembrane metalloprotease [Burkholderiaceae bacterium]|nr:CPBP family intramembrane metalloprotease [Burkholderiaceae bacterium]
MRRVAHWAPVFLLLFAWYQAAEGVGVLWLNQPAIAAAIMLGFLPLAWIAARALGARPAVAYGLCWSGRNAAWLAAGLALALAAKAISLAVGTALNIVVPAAAPPAAPAAWQAAGALGWLALATFVPSLAEDILARGFWSRLPAWHWSAPGFVLSTSLVYTLNHVYRLKNGPAEWFMLFCFGLLYATAFWRSGTLWAAVGLHWGWNLAGQSIPLGWPTEVVDPVSARLLSGLTHLAMLALVLGITPCVGLRRARPAPPGG